MIRHVYTLYRYRCDVPHCTAEGESEYDSRLKGGEWCLPTLPPGWVRSSRFMAEHEGPALVFCPGHEPEELLALIFEFSPQSLGGRMLDLSAEEVEVVEQALVHLAGNTIADDIARRLARR